MTKLFTMILFCCVVSISLTQRPFSDKVISRIMVDFDNGTLPIKKNGKWGLVDANNEVKIPIDYDSVFYAGKNLCILQKGKKYFFVNENFQTLHEADSLNFDHKRGRHTVQFGGNQQFFLYTNEELSFFSSDEDLYKFNLKSSETLYDRDKFHWEKTYSKIKGIDTLYQISDGDQLRIKVKFIDGREYVSEKSSRFEFMEPCFFSYSSICLDNSVEQKLWNIETGELLTFKNKFLLRTFTLENKIYLVFGTEIREYGSDYSLTLKKNFYQHGRLLVCHHYSTPGTYDIIDLLSGKVLYESLEQIEQKNGILICQDKNKETILLNEFGQNFYSTKHTLFPKISTIVDGTYFNPNLKIYAIIAYDNSWTIISNSGKIYATGKERLQYTYFETVYWMDNNVGYYVDEKDDFVVHNCIGDFYHLRNGYFKNTVANKSSWKDMITIRDKNNAILIDILFERLDLLAFYHDDNFLLFGGANGNLVLLDRDLKVMNLPFENKPSIRLKSIRFKYGEKEDFDETYFQVYDKDTRTVKAIMDSKFNMINLDDDVMGVLCHPTGKFFVIFYNNGEYGYMRFDGTRLY